MCCNSVQQLWKFATYEVECFCSIKHRTRAKILPQHTSTTDKQWTTLWPLQVFSNALTLAYRKLNTAVCPTLEICSTDWSIWRETISERMPRTNFVKLSHLQTFTATCIQYATANIHPNSFQICTERPLSITRCHSRKTISHILLQLMRGYSMKCWQCKCTTVCTKAFCIKIL